MCVINAEILLYLSPSIGLPVVLTPDRLKSEIWNFKHYIERGQYRDNAFLFIFHIVRFEVATELFWQNPSSRNFSFAMYRFNWLPNYFPAQSGNMWQSGWQGGANDGNQPQTTTQQHQAGNHAEEQFSDMFRMLDPPGQDFNDLSGMFHNFTDWWEICFLCVYGTLAAIWSLICHYVDIVS